MKHFPLVHEAARKRAAEFAMTAPEGWEAIYGPAKMLRSYGQNAAYWAFIYEMVDAGLRDDEGKPYTAIRIHEAMKRMFLGKYIQVLPNGDVKELPATTKLLNSKQFSEYMDRVQAYLTQLQAGIA